MIEIRTDWVNNIEYSWNDFAAVLALQGLMIISMAYTFYKLR